MLLARTQPNFKGWLLVDYFFDLLIKLSFSLPFFYATPAVLTPSHQVYPPSSLPLILRKKHCVLQYCVRFCIEHNLMYRARRTLGPQTSQFFDADRQLWEYRGHIPCIEQLSLNCLLDPPFSM